MTYNTSIVINTVSNILSATFLTPFVLKLSFHRFFSLF
nr:MAG TPA: hypothetical protein [Caudoviricetes sp.]